MLSRHLNYRAAQRLSKRKLARRHSLNSVFGLSDFDEQLEWRIAWDFDPSLVSGVTISFDGTLWVESWRQGVLDDCFDVVSLAEARELAVQEVRRYLLWRQAHTGSSGRTACIYLPRDPGSLACGAEAVIALNGPATDIKPTLVPSGTRAFSQRVRTASEMLFWARPVFAVEADVTDQQLEADFVNVGVVRDCGHLTLAPDALRRLVGAAQHTSLDLEVPGALRSSPESAS